MIARTLAILTLATAAAAELPPPPPLAFEAETILIFAEGDSLRVDATYILYYSGAKAAEVPLPYPYPEDERLGGATLLLVESRPVGDEAWQPVRAVTRPGAYHSTLVVPFAADQRREIHVVYRQATPERYARYIVTTTRSWFRPLQHARFEIRLPEGAVPVRFSHPFATREIAGETVYVHEECDFYPDRDIFVTWEDAGGPARSQDPPPGY